ncbi:germ cell nuclear acidic protein isoform X3 [Paroedura picta]|uniref:germ cell nuclear acidic protein isoform X3 n=1 Tax=Paroedura picta TaxID=143630 RepID=UPI004056C30E
MSGFLGPGLSSPTRASLGGSVTSGPAAGPGGEGPRSGAAAGREGALPPEAEAGGLSRLGPPAISLPFRLGGKDERRRAGGLRLRRARRDAAAAAASSSSSLARPACQPAGTYGCPLKLQNTFGVQWYCSDQQSFIQVLGQMAQQTISTECILERTKWSSSGSDDEFENCAALELYWGWVLSRMKTPKSTTCCTPRAKNTRLRHQMYRYTCAKDQIKEVWTGTTKKLFLFLPSLADSKANSFLHLTKKEEFTDSDDDCVFGKHASSLRSPYQSVQVGHQSGMLSASSQEKPITSKDGPTSSRNEGKSSTKENTQGKAQQLRPSVMHGCSSSDDEIDSLIVRVKQRMVFPATKSAEGQTGSAGQRGFKSSCENIPATTKTEGVSLEPFRSPAPVQRPSQVLADVTQRPQMPVRSGCQVQDCFLHELSDPKSQQAREFRTKKKEMAQRLYVFYNRTVFEQKLPEIMEISWNKKMRKTAGCCITGRMKEPNLGQRYARIMLSEKVCDSADRLRDTLIHEMCHAAAWLIHGIQDGHGRFWSLYAKKSALIHPELPVVSRCHNYEIKYKFMYECSRCQNTIGRHSKSLDTQRFVCALCKGQLVLWQPTRKDGTPAEASLTPFAKYVKENYASAKQSQQGLTHGAIMKKLSSDFASQP